MKKIVIDARQSGTSTGRYIDKLIEYLHKLNPKFKVIILTKNHRIDFIKSIAPSFEVVKTPYKEFTFAEQLGFRGQISKLEADLVHFGMVQQPILYWGKVATTMHDLTTARFRNPAKNPIVFTTKQYVYKFVNRVAASKSAAIIVPTEYVKEDVAKFTGVNSRKITVTYEAADKIDEDPEAIDYLSGDQFLLYVGKPEPHKNLYRLVVAFKKVKQSSPDLKLVLAGKKSSNYDQLEGWVNNQGIKDVVFTDFVSEGQLRWLYEKCEAYIFPSLSEGFGLPGLEAMQHGAPVISSSATCLPEVYGDAALYFDPLDIDDMATKINELLKNQSLRKTLIKKGAEQVKKYSWKKMAEQTLEVYSSILDDVSSR